MSPAPGLPACIFCGRVADSTPCSDPRTDGAHVDFWSSTAEQRDRRFGPATPRPVIPAPRAAEASPVQPGLLL